LSFFEVGNHSILINDKNIALIILDPEILMHFTVFVIIKTDA
jgi:hypothetical protein